MCNKEENYTFSMDITRNEKYSPWEHTSFEHVQNFRAGLPKYHGWEVHYLNLQVFARMTRNNPLIEQEQSIRPHSGVDSWQWDLGIRWRPNSYNFCYKLLLLLEIPPLKLTLDILLHAIQIKIIQIGLATIWTPVIIRSYTCRSSIVEFWV